MMNIAQLLRAADYLDRREREAEHGYASTVPMPSELTKKKTKTKKSQGNRNIQQLPVSLPSNESVAISVVKVKKEYWKLIATDMRIEFFERSTHNELEKNRRAHLRNCLEKLKDLVPLGTDSARHTTLGLLTKTKAFIRQLEDRDRKQGSVKDNLHREHRYLQRRLEYLTNGQYRERQERSISECSTSTNSTSTSTSESDEIDIVGYNSSHSDTDDHSSIQSGGSDGGFSTVHNNNNNSSSSSTSAQTSTFNIMSGDVCLSFASTDIGNSREELEIYSSGKRATTPQH